MIIVFFNDMQLHKGYVLLNAEQVYVVGKDFGVRIAHIFATLHPDRISGFITFGVPPVPLNRPRLAEPLPEGVYSSRWMVNNSHPYAFSCLS